MKCLCTCVLLSKDARLLEVVGSWIVGFVIRKEGWVIIMDMPIDDRLKFLYEKVFIVY